jgi:hypothetical protein
LIQEACGSLRALAEALAIELGDLQLQKGDERLIVGEPSPGGSEFALDVRGMSPRRDQRRLERVDVLGKRIRRRRHAAD